MSRCRSSLKIFCLASLLASIAACRSPEREESAPSAPVRISWPENDRVALRDTELPPFVLGEEKQKGSGNFNNIFWLDFEGADVSAGDSFIVKNAGLSTVKIPPFLPQDIGSDKDQETLKQTIQRELLTLFPGVDLLLTRTRPVGKIFSRVHIGGDNFTGRQQILGIAPLDLGNLRGDDVLFVYPRVLGPGADPEGKTLELVHAIAHEIAHSLGARHIDNEKALMRTSVSLSANSFNLSGPVVGAESEIENSLEILLHSVGSKDLGRAQASLPEIVDLDAFATGDLIQYTVLNQKNMELNPNRALANFRYDWELEGVKSTGTSILMRFEDRDDHLLKLRVSNASGASRSFEFLVGRRR